MTLRILALTLQRLHMLGCRRCTVKSLTILHVHNLL